MFGETILIGIVLGGILVAQLMASGAAVLLTRRLGLDEIITGMLVMDPDVSRSLRAIAGGLDTNPPLYHLLLRPLRPVLAVRPETGLRCVSAAAALIALVGVYVTLRQVYTPVVAIAAVLAVWCHPLLQRCAFEGRMYTSWLAAIVWCACLLSRSASAPADDHVLHALLAGVAVLSCMLHTLGPLSLFLVLGAQLLFAGSGRPSVDGVMWAAVGFIVFAGWMPIVWKQSVANPVSWVRPATARNVAGFVRSMLFPPGLATLLLLIGGSASLFLHGYLLANAGAQGAAALGGLAGLLGMPVALIVLSLTVEPLLVDRYAVPVVAGFAPAVAAIIAPLGPWWTVLLIGVLAVAGAFHLHSLHAEYRDTDRAMTGLLAAIERHAGRSPVYFERLHEFAVVARYRPSGQYMVIDFARDAASAGEHVRMPASNQARLIGKYYGGMTLIPWRAVRALPDFYVVVPCALNASSPEPARVRERYPEFDVLPLSGGLYRLVATTHVVSSIEDSPVAAPVLPPESGATSETVTGNATG